jgi:hypothetical protein
MRFMATLVLTLCCAAPAMAAPTCQARDGMTMRCGAPGAMPVGWTAPRLEHPLPQVSTHDIWEAAAGLILLLALIALLPEFDGSRSKDWVAERSEEDRRNDPADPFD